MISAVECEVLSISPTKTICSRICQIVAHCYLSHVYFVVFSTATDKYAIIPAVFNQNLNGSFGSDRNLARTMFRQHVKTQQNVLYNINKAPRSNLFHSSSQCGTFLHTRMHNMFEMAFVFILSMARISNILQIIHSYGIDKHVVVLMPLVVYTLKLI